jgi:hypothetical protein
MIIVADDEVDQVINVMLIDRSMEPNCGHVTRLYRCLVELVDSTLHCQ